MAWDSWGPSWGVVGEIVPPDPVDAAEEQDDFYNRMQATATRLLLKYKQGSASLRRAETALLGKPWTPNKITFVDYPLTVVVEPVFKQFVDNSLVTADSRMVIFQKLSIEPMMTDQIILGSVLFEVKKFLRYPATGIVVYYAAIISA